MKNVKLDLRTFKDGRFKIWNVPYMFLCYWSNHEGLSEHGTTVRCSWLTDKGRELLNDINWCLENEKYDNDVVS